MFTNGNGATPTPNRPAASDVARLEGDLTQIFVSGTSSVDIHVFVNGVPVSPGDVESVSLEIIAPDDNGGGGTVSAVMSRYALSPGGTRAQKSASLFPGTVEIVASGRRVLVTCQQDGSFDGLFLSLGLRADGTSSELSGVQSLRVAVTPGLLDARLTWSEDGMTESLLG